MEPGAQCKYRSPQGIAGIVSCAVMLGCGRWGAKLGVPPLYIGDLLLVVAICHIAASRFLIGTPALTGVARRAHPGFPVLLLLAWALLRFLFGSDYGLVALRDFVPYAYAGIALVSASTYARSHSADRSRTVRILEMALLWHLLWVVGSQLVNGPIPPSDLGEGSRLFLVRGDNGGVLGITVCLFLNRYLRCGGPIRLLIVALALGSMLAMSSRAALLATVTGLVLTVACYFFTTDDVRRGRKAAMLGAIPLALFLFVALLPNTPAGSKLLVSVGVKQPQSSLDVSGLGTEQARSRAWERVISYMAQDLSREMLGMGFGPHYLIDSGASVALVHGDDPLVRSPHNYFVNTYARLGLAGLMVLAFIIGQMLVGIWRVRRLIGSDDLLLLAAIIPPLLLVQGAVGATLEAPFGAIPFFWFLGVLLTYPAEQPEPDDAATLREQGATEHSVAKLVI
jgi:hypothetical protein